MNNQIANPSDRCVRREFGGGSLRAGIAKDQLIFLIICLATEAVVILVHFVRGGSTEGEVVTTWQCLKCGYEFSGRKLTGPPALCPKCGGSNWVSADSQNKAAVSE